MQASTSSSKNSSRILSQDVHLPFLDKACQGEYNGVFPCALNKEFYGLSSPGSDHAKDPTSLEKYGQHLGMILIKWSDPNNVPDQTQEARSAAISQGSAGIFQIAQLGDSPFLMKPTVRRLETAVNSVLSEYESWSSGFPTAPTAGNGSSGSQAA